MRVRKKDQKNVIKVGIFITFLTGILMAMIVSIGKENSIFDKKVEIRAHVANVSALKPGSYVELRGIRIGAVSEIRIISADEVEITMTILEEQLKWIKADSKISISTAGLVGDKFIEIYNGTKNAAVFDPKKDILISEDFTDLKRIMTKGDSIATTTDRILMKLDNILAKIGDGQMLVDSISSFHKTSLHLEKITDELKDAKLGQVVGNMNSSANHFNKTSKTLERILQKIEKGPGTMNSLIYDDGLHEDLRALLGGAQRNKVIKYYIRESIKNSEQKVPIN